MLAVTALLGAVPGLVAGFVPRADAVIMRVMDALMAFPAILLALSVMAIAGPSTVNVVGALGVAYAPRMARLARASVLAVRSREFVDAARALGNPPLRVLARHVTPNAAAPVIVQGTFTVGYAILGEAALSFVGLGAVPPTPSLGNILADARVFLRDAPWMILCPAATLALLILGLNLLGDGIRDALDPADDGDLRGRRVDLPPVQRSSISGRLDVSTEVGLTPGRRLGERPASTAARNPPVPNGYAQGRGAGEDVRPKNAWALSWKIRW